MRNKILLVLLILLTFSTLILGTFVYIKYFHSNVTVENKGNVKLTYIRSDVFEKHLVDQGLWEKNNIVLPDNKSKKHTVSKLLIKITKTQQQYFVMNDLKKTNSQIFSIGAEVKNNTLILPVYIAPLKNISEKENLDEEVSRGITAMISVVANDGLFPHETVPIITKDRLSWPYNYPTPFKVDKN